MANMTAHRASYFKNWPKVNEFWFLSNGTAFFNPNAAANNAANLKKQGRSDAIVHLTRADYDAWVKAGGENGVAAPDTNTGVAAPEPNKSEPEPNGGAAPEPNKSEPEPNGGAAPEPNKPEPDPNGGAAPEPTPRDLAEKELAEALAAQGELAKNASQKKKDAAAARVAAATAKVEELSK